MENITGELRERDAVMCMRCGSIYTGEDAYNGECRECGDKGWINWVNGTMHEDFWYSQVQQRIASEFAPEEK